MKHQPLEKLEAQLQQKRTKLIKKHIDPIDTKLHKLNALKYKTLCDDTLENFLLYKVDQVKSDSKSRELFTINAFGRVPKDDEFELMKEKFTMTHSELSFTERNSIIYKIYYRGLYEYGFNKFKDYLEKLAEDNDVVCKIRICIVDMKHEHTFYFESI